MLVTFLVFAALSLLSLFALLWYFMPSGRRVTTVPGLAPSDEKLGNIPNIADAGSLPEFLSNLHSEFGPIASFWYGEYLTISLGTSKLFKQVENLFSPRDTRPALFQSLVPVVADPAVHTQQGDHGRFLHEVLSRLQPFHHPGDGVEEEVVTLTQELCSVWKQLQDDDHIPALDYMSALAVKIVTTTQLGPYFQEEEKVADFIEAYNGVMTDLELKMLVEVYWDEDDPRELAFRKKIAKFKEILTSAVEHCLKQKPGSSARVPFLMQTLAKHQDMDTIVTSVAAFAITEITTIGWLLTWSLHYLSTHPDVQTRARNEAKASKLSYLRQVLREVVRITHFVPFATRVQHQREIAVAGHVLEPGTLVLLSLSTAAWDPKTYPNPEKFEPDRFSPDMPDPAVFELQNPGGTSDLASSAVAAAVATCLSMFEVEPADPGVSYGVKCCPFSKPDNDIWLTLKKIS